MRLPPPFDRVARTLDAAMPVRSRRLTAGAGVSLPSADGRPHERAASLAAARSRYAYHPPDSPKNVMAPVAVAARWPWSEQYDASWALPYLPLYLRATARQWSLGVTEGLLGRARRGSKTASYERFANGRFAAGPAARNYATDARLVSDRLQGPNPVAIRRVRDAGDVRRLLGDLGDDVVAGCGVTLAGALDHGTLYQVEYSLLREGLVGGSARDSRWRGRYLPSPQALFWQRPDDERRRTLSPVAVRIDGWDHESPVFRPGDGAGWETAKLYLRSADVNAHIMGTHLWANHFVLEPFAVTTPRRLAAHHPVAVLLRPHLRFTLAVNRSVVSWMGNPDQVFARIYGGDLATTRRIVTAARARADFSRMGLIDDLDERGMADAPVDYPYRDDALPYWAAIGRFVSAYVDLYYDSDAAVRDDDELRAWAAELGDARGGALPGLGDMDATLSRDGLVRLLTQVLFTAGPGHAAVHFPQPDFHAVVGAYPAAPYAPPPRSLAEADAARHEAALPPVGPAVAQFRNALLAGFRYDTFGDYAGYPLGRLDVAQPALRAFRAELAAIEDAVGARNAEREIPYEYLRPSRVPNSINL